MSSINLSIPSIDTSKLNDRTYARQIISHLSLLSEQFNYFMYNVGQENMDTEMCTKITQIGDNTAKIAASDNRIDLLVTSLEDAVSSISVLENQIELKVSKGNVSSQISMESGQITISSNRFVLNSTNCTIESDGTITGSNANFTGGTVTGAHIISVAESHRTEIDGGVLTSSFARYYQPVTNGFNTNAGIEISYADIQLFTGYNITTITSSGITTPSIVVCGVNIYSALQDLSGRIQQLENA